MQIWNVKFVAFSKTAVAAVPILKWLGYEITAIYVHFKPVTLSARY